MKHCCLFLVLALLFLTQAFSLPKTYYVATTGSDSNTGLTIDQPFLTIPKAIGLVPTIFFVVPNGDVLLPALEKQINMKP